MDKIPDVYRCPSCDSLPYLLDLNWLNLNSGNDVHVIEHQYKFQCKSTCRTRFSSLMHTTVRKAAEVWNEKITRYHRNHQLPSPKFEKDRVNILDPLE